MNIAPWMLRWFGLSMLIVFWDISFLFFRPYSMPGESMSHIWAPYAKYIAVDLSYADLNNPFVKAQAMMSFMEIIMGLAVFRWAYLKKTVPAALLLMVVSMMTAAKTCLILVVECVSGFENVGHADLADIIAVYAIPNLVWVVIPLWVAISLGRQFGAHAYFQENSPMG